MYIKSLEKAAQLVANAMSNASHRVEVVFGSGAFTNGRQITIPANLPEDEQTLARVMGFLLHEAAHIRWTDFSAAGSEKAVFMMTNAIEDARIENLLRRCFLGSCAFIDKMNAYLLPDVLKADRSVFSTVGTWVYCRLSAADSPMLAQAGNEFLRRLSVRFGAQNVAKLEALAASAPLETTADAVALARKVLRWLCDMLAVEKIRPEDPKGSKGSTGSKDSEGSKGSKSSKGSKGSEGSEGSKDSKGSEGTTGSEDSKGSEDSRGSEDSKGSGGSQGSEDSESSQADSSVELTDQARCIAWAELQKIADGSECNALDISAKGAMSLADRSTLALIAGSGYNRGYLRSAPKSERWKRNGQMVVQEATSVADTLGRNLTGLIASQTRRRTRNSVRGARVDGRRLARLTSGDTRIFMRMGEDRGIDTACLILLDRSSSMDSDFEDRARTAAVGLFLALRRIHRVSCGLMRFPLISGSKFVNVAMVCPPQENVNQRLGDLGLLQSNGGGTPINDALCVAKTVLADRPEHRKLVIVITDGCFQLTQEVVRAYRQSDTELAFLFIRAVPQSEAARFPHAVIFDRSAVTEAVFALARKLAPGLRRDR